MFQDHLKNQQVEKERLTNEYKTLLAEKQTLKTGSSDIPLHVLTDPTKADMSVLRELAHLTFEKVLVYPDRIKIVMKNSFDDEGNNRSFEIERVKVRNCNNLPFWKARINADTIGTDTKIGIGYYYKSTSIGVYDKVEILYSDDNMEIVAFGNNKSIDKKRAEEKPSKPALFDKMMVDVFGEPPKYGQKLEINSEAFFTGRTDFGDLVEV